MQTVLEIGLKVGWTNLIVFELIRIWIGLRTSSKSYNRVYSVFDPNLVQK